MGTRYFKRTVSLPTEVIGEKAEAEYSDGILKVTIPKAKPKEVKEKKIKVKVKK
jgi:HSP20 family molecular chaperone IbpA